MTFQAASLKPRSRGVRVAGRSKHGSAGWEGRGLGGGTGLLAQSPVCSLQIGQQALGPPPACCHLLSPFLLYHPGLGYTFPHRTLVLEIINTCPSPGHGSSPLSSLGARLPG